MPELTHTITQAKFTYAYPSNSKQGSSLETNMFTSTATAAMSRSTSLAVGNHAATDCTMSGGVLDCSAFDTEEEGEGGVHNNMQPYLALVYIIQTIPDTPPAPRMLIYNGCMPVTPGGYYLVGTKR
jgi:microcystin-dependent protein